MFTHPIYLWILLLLPILVLTHIFVFRNKRPMALKFSNFLALEKVAGKSLLASRKGFLTKRDILLLILRTTTYSFFILAISGMMIEYSENVSNSDFVLAIDSSSSMSADDFYPNRLESAKESALLFTNSVAKQTNIGIVSFGGDISINLRPTNKPKKIRDTIKDINLKETGGTNIGDALITSVNIFSGDNPKKIILLTDGQSNIGPEPIEAIGYLNSKNITTYTIGVATEKGGYAIDFVSRLDEETLKTIAEKTNGIYYKAGDKDILKKIFEEIASSTIKKISLDISWACLTIGFITLILEWLLSTTKYSMLP